MRKIKLLLFIFLATLSTVKGQFINANDTAALHLLKTHGFIPNSLFFGAQFSLGSIPPAFGAAGITFAFDTPNFQWRVAELRLRGRRAINLGTATPLNASVLDVLFLPGRLDSLRLLDISSNNLNGVFSTLSIIPSSPLVLSHMDISDNEFTEVMAAQPNYCGSFPIRSFRANNNQLNPEALTNIISLCNDATLDSIFLRHGLDSNTTWIELDVNNNVLNSSCRGGNLKFLDLSFNRIEELTNGDIFEQLPNIEHLNLSHNNIRLPMPPPVGENPLANALGSPTGIYSPSFSGLANLVELDLSYNRLSDSSNPTTPFPLHWFIGKQLSLAQTDRPLTNIKLRNAGLHHIQGTNNYTETPGGPLNLGSETILYLTSIGNMTVPFFPSLDIVDLDSNSLKFTDLYHAAIQLGIDTNTNSAYNTSTGHFFYRYQAPLGVGGIRRRPSNERFDFKVSKNIDNPARICATCANFENVYQIFWKRRQNSTDSVTLFSTGSANVTPNLPSNGIGGSAVGMDRPYVGDLMKVSMNMVDSILDESYVTGKLTNPRFPNVEIFIREKMIRAGQCFDTLGQIVKCQEIAVQIDENIDPADLEYHKRYYGAEVIDECVCGKVQLWSLSDTFQTAYLETNGKTTVNQSGTQSRPGLKSADHNYPLLDNNNNWTAAPSLATAITNATPDTSRVLMAIIDSGTDIDHPRINPFIKRNTYETVTHPSPMSLDSIDNDQNCEIDDVVGYNYFDRTNIAYDDHGHGTAVAGIAVGLGSPALAPENQQAVSILPIKYTNRKNEGSTFHASCGIYYAAEYNKNHSNNTINPRSAKVRIINASWGYRGESCVVLKDAIKYAGDQNILFVCPTGNDGINLDTAKHYPSNYPLANILAVTSIDSDNSTISSYANRSATHADIAAYGTYNVLMQPHDFINQPVDSTTVQQEGTSFSTPMVARAAAILTYEFKDASFCDVKAALMESAVPLNSSDSGLIRSRGYVDLNAARSYMQSMILGQSVCDTAGNVSAILPVVENHSNRNNSSYRLYPNPTQNTLYVEFLQNNLSNQPLTVSILDAKGQVLYNQIFAQNSNQLSIPTANLAQGFYILQVKSANGIAAEKFIKMD